MLLTSDTTAPYNSQRCLALMDSTTVPINGLVQGALDSQSLGPGSMLGTEVCLFILPSSSPELSEIFRQYNSQRCLALMDSASLQSRAVIYRD